MRGRERRGRGERERENRFDDKGERAKKFLDDKPVHDHLYLRDPRSCVSVCPITVSFFLISLYQVLCPFPYVYIYIERAGEKDHRHVYVCVALPTDEIITERARARARASERASERERERERD